MIILKGLLNSAYNDQIYVSDNKSVFESRNIFVYNCQYVVKFSLGHCYGDFWPYVGDLVLHINSVYVLTNAVCEVGSVSLGVAVIVFVLISHCPLLWSIQMWFRVLFIFTLHLHPWINLRKE